MTESLGKISTYSYWVSRLSACQCLRDWGIKASTAELLWFLMSFLYLNCTVWVALVGEREKHAFPSLATLREQAFAGTQLPIESHCCLLGSHAVCMSGGSQECGQSHVSDEGSNTEN